MAKIWYTVYKIRSDLNLEFKMGVSNFRIRETSTVHHILNRIAHRVFFLRDEERNDFIEMMRRAAEFVGVKLLGWCVMTNHFHILAFLPEREELGEEEIIRRVGILKGANAGEVLRAKLARLRAGSSEGDAEVQKILDGYRHRMYDIGSFMKMLKQWFTEEYNRRTAHVGTLWESAYIDRAVALNSSNMAKVLSYICLNPIRGGLCAKYDEYVWSSLYAVSRGDRQAIDGLRFIYGEEASVEEMREALYRQMDIMLDAEKRQWAQEVARRRAAGYPVPENPLTDEAYVAQEVAHVEEAIRAGTTLHEQSLVYRKCEEKRKDIQRRIVEEIRKTPTAPVRVLSERSGVSAATAYAYLKDLVSCGVIRREEPRKGWRIDESEFTKLGLT